MHCLLPYFETTYVKQQFTISIIVCVCPQMIVGCLFAVYRENSILEIIMEQQNQATKISW